jgi:hypothetical protein
MPSTVNTPGTDHPELPANRQRGSQQFTGVRTQYAVETRRFVLGGRDREAQLLVGRGGIARWYAPFVRMELPGELAKLRSADEADMLSFASAYGRLGFSFLATYQKGDTVTPELGDPLPWIRAHANGVHACLELTAVLQSRAGRRRDSDLERQLHSMSGSTWGDGAQARELSIVWAGESPEAMARQWRRRIINANVRTIHRSVSVNENRRDQTFFGYPAMIAVVYWHLANLIDGGSVKRCEAEGCGSFFVQTDPRQRFCPARIQGLESNCAMRQRKRNQLFRERKRLHKRRSGDG